MQYTWIFNLKCCLPSPSFFLCLHMNTTILFWINEFFITSILKQYEGM